MSDAPSNPDRWRLRRKVVFGGLFFCAAVVLYALLSPADHLDPMTRQTAIVQAFWGGMGIIGAYVFGAVWDDKGRP